MSEKVREMLLLWLRIEGVAPESLSAPLVDRAKALPLSREDEKRVEKVARWMRDSMRLGGINVCRGFLQEALEGEPGGVGPDRAGGGRSQVVPVAVEAGDAHHDGYGVE